MPAGKIILVGDPSAKRKKRGKKSVKIEITDKKKEKVKSNQQLTKDVKKLVITQRGSLQIERQMVRFVAPPDPQPDPPYFFNAKMPTTIRPLAFLHQAISRGSYVFTLKYGPGPPPTTVLPVEQAGTWIEQPFPLIQTVASGGYGLPSTDYGRFDQLQYWGGSEGVSNDYTHLSTKYEILMEAVECRGYVDIFRVHPKKSFLRSVQQDSSLVAGLAGFCGMSLGATNMYSINNQYYTCKRLKRKYFNTTRPTGGAAAGENYLNTNPEIDLSFTVKNDKSRSHVKAAELPSGATLDSTDIDLKKQDWIIISTTLENKDVSASNHLLVRAIYRTPIWRDREGAST